MKRIAKPKREGKLRKSGRGRNSGKPGSIAAAAMVADLNKSGLTPKELNAYALDPAGLQRALANFGRAPAESFITFGATVFPYYDIDGEIADGYAALRLHTKNERELESVWLRKYINLDLKAKEYSYNAPRFYLPPTLKGGWKAIADDVSRAIYFTRLAMLFARLVEEPA